MGSDQKAMKRLRQPSVPEPVTVHIRSGTPAPRLFEWMTAIMMIGIAFVAAMNPRSISLGGFHYMQELGLNAQTLAVIFLFAGIARVAGLFANGNWPVVGPRFRAGGALVGALIWLQMLYSLVLWSSKIGYISIGVAVYAVLALGEFISCWRAATDVRHP